MKPNLTDLLDSVSVMEPGMWENDLSSQPLLSNWFAVCNDNGIIAYFATHSDACRFRLDYINGHLNPV